MKSLKRNDWGAYLFILPIFILFGIFVVYPVIYNIIISFHEWSGVGTSKTFVGIKNYVDVFSDKVIWKVMRNFVIFAFVTIIVQAFFGLIFASFFRNLLPGRGIFRILFYLPAVVTSTVIGQVFSKFFEANKGNLNTFLRYIGVTGKLPTWLADPKLALWCVIFVNIWQWIGYSMLLYYAGMMNIPDDIYEAAEIDGASKLQQFRLVTFPMLRSTHYTLFILGMIGSLKCYDIVYVLTGGGPNYATEMFTTYIQTLSFEKFKQGQASTVVVIMFVIAMVITAVQLKMYYGKGKEQGE